MPRYHFHLERFRQNEVFRSPVLYASSESNTVDAGCCGIVHILKTAYAVLFYEKARGGLYRRILRRPGPATVSQPHGKTLLGGVKGRSRFPRDNPPVFRKATRRRAHSKTQGHALDLPVSIGGADTGNKQRQDFPEPVPYLFPVFRQPFKEQPPRVPVASFRPFPDMKG